MSRAHPTAAFSDIFALGRPRNLLPADDARSRYTLKARGAIVQFLRALPRAQRPDVLLPAYHCPTIVYAIEQAGFSPRYYGVNDDLSIDRATLLGALGARTAAVIAINFFGFPTPLAGIVEAVRDSGAALLEDCSHSFLYANPLRLAGERGDAAVYALWKLVPSGVGGLVTRAGTGDALPVPPAALPLAKSVRLWKRLGEEAIENLPDGLPRRALLALERWRVRGRQAVVDRSESADDGAPIDVHVRYPVLREDFDCGLPLLQRHMVQRADLEAIARARRANYQVFADLLGDLPDARAQFPVLPADVVPWCFPLRLNGRRRFDFRMRERGVPLFTFGETLHPTLFEPGAVPATALERACGFRDDILCLGVHQKLTPPMVSEAAQRVREVLSAERGVSPRAEVASCR